MQGLTALLLVLCMVLPACENVSFSLGGLDTAQLEEEIERGLEDQAEGIDIDGVECPRGVQPEAGTVFVCRALAADGSVGTVEVEQVDADGNVEWELTDVAAPPGDTPSERESVEE